ncbi:g5555 [Coccomyxa elongata]
MSAAMKLFLAALVLCAAAPSCIAESALQEDVQGRKLQQFPIPLPIAIPLPPFLTGGGGLPAFGGPQPRQPASLQTQPRANASANGGCTATFAGVLASQPDLFFISSALGLSGFQNSLPSPSLGLTIFAPNNAGFLQLLDELNLGLLDLLQLQDKLPGLLLYHVSLGGLNGDQLLQRGSIDTLLSLATGQPYPLNFSVDPTNAQRLVVSTIHPGNQARTLRAIKVCQSYIYIIDEILLPTSNNTLASVPAVNTTFLQSLIGAGANAAPASGASGVGTITDPNCRTSFLAAAQGTPGLDFLVQAIQRGNLADVLPAAGSGATVFAPNNDAFTNMLQTLNLTIVDALNLGDKLQSLLYYHFLPSAYTSNQLVATGTLNTDLGISTGTPYNLTFGAAQDGTAKVQVAGQYPGNKANILSSTSVCNSIVHVVDQVLLPTASLDTVPPPGNGLTGGQAAGQQPGGIAGLFPGLRIGNKQAKATGRCPQAFLDTANKQNLTFLVQAIQAGGLTSELPDFAVPSTAFAPVNGAFYKIITGTDYGLDKLATAGTRLKSVLLYHISPNGSLTLDQLGAAGNLTTVLGQDLNASYPLLAGVNSTNGAVVDGLFPGNSANILGSFTVCNSTVYLVDTVLLPAASLEAIPQINTTTATSAAQPVAAPALAPKTGPVSAQSLPAARPLPAIAAAPAARPAATGAAAANAPVLNGAAFGAGWYTGCPVTYQAGQTTGQATTNNAGAFAIPVPGATSFSNGLVSLAANSPGCVDALTKLPPPFSMGALVPPAKGGQAPTPAVNAVTTIAYYLKQNANSPQLASVLPLLGGADFTADQLDTLLGVAFKVSNAGTAIPSTNYVSGLLGGDLNSLKLEVLNAELLTSLVIGAQVLISLRPNGQQLTVDQAVQALYLSTLPVGVSAVTGGGSFSLTSADVQAKTLDAAVASFGAAPAAAAGSGAAAGAGGRRLAQAATAAAPASSSSVTSDPRIQAVGTTTGQLNTKLEAITASFSAGSIDANAALSQIAQIVKVAQAQVAPAVAQLLGQNPTLTVQAFQQAYSGSALDTLVAA